MPADMSDGKNIGSMAPEKKDAPADATKEAYSEAMELEDNDNENEEEE